MEFADAALGGFNFTIYPVGAQGFN